MNEHRPSSELWRLLERTRNNLTWLREQEGCRETQDLQDSRFHLDVEGENACVSVTVCPERNELEIWMRRPDDSGIGTRMQRYLEGRGLQAPHFRFEGDSPQDAFAAVDEHTAALRQLRDYELSGDWMEW
jgi:hypothetical protein